MHAEDLKVLPLRCVVHDAMGSPRRSLVDHRQVGASSDALDPCLAVARHLDSVKNGRLDGIAPALLQRLALCIAEDRFKVYGAVRLGHLSASLLFVHRVGHFPRLGKVDIAIRGKDPRDVTAVHLAEPANDVFERVDVILQGVSILGRDKDGGKRRVVALIGVAKLGVVDASRPSILKLQTSGCREMANKPVGQERLRSGHVVPLPPEIVGHRRLGQLQVQIARPDGGSHVNDASHRDPLAVLLVWRRRHGAGNALGATD
ncbi:hypothetical protein H310_12691 [Aphanomyces invadans]|uniref:Uncharacterized protein n=1 Tax=Aphanomyces invadans TaxID=157072 RepID=A0A024TGG7_9STRA|nr:hypothetical protein H310_12691 [Aphanomyces invadans]ETV93255.1 hypothetical protein H310_12691 [Aphanomyces invadans]|eukprot:XP_008878090.1 hypothetical protein H310_12691 [Aphanomyces invadans]